MFTKRLPSPNSPGHTRYFFEIKNWPVFILLQNLCWNIKIHQQPAASNRSGVYPSWKVEKNSLKANEPVKCISSGKICQELLSSRQCAQLNYGLIPLQTNRPFLESLDKWSRINLLTCWTTLEKYHITMFSIYQTLCKNIEEEAVRCARKKIKLGYVKSFHGLSLLQKQIGKLKALLLAGHFHHWFCKERNKKKRTHGHYSHITELQVQFTYYTNLNKSKGILLAPSGR